MSMIFKTLICPSCETKKQTCTFIHDGDSDTPDDVYIKDEGTHLGEYICYECGKKE